MKFKVGVGLFILGVLAWVALAIWTFSGGHASEPVTLPFQIGTVVGIFGPMVAGAWLMASKP